MGSFVVRRLAAVSSVLIIALAGCPREPDEPSDSGSPAAEDGGQSPDKPDKPDPVNPDSPDPDQPDAPSPEEARQAIVDGGKNVSLEVDAAGNVIAGSGSMRFPRGARGDVGDKAVAFMQAHAPALGLPSDQATTVIDVVVAGASSIAHLDVRYRDVPVLGAGVTLRGQGGQLRTFVSRLPGPLSLDVEAKASKPSDTSRLVIVVPELLGAGPGEPKLAWETTVEESWEEAYIEYTDAVSGSALFSVPDGDDFGPPQTQTFETCEAFGTVCRKKWFTEAGKVLPEEPPAEVAQAHEHAQNVANYLLETFKRRSWDGGGALIKTYVTPMRRKAFWRQSTGTLFVQPQWVAYDVLAHELGHGIVRTHAPRLLSGGYGGAVNEAFADIFAFGADDNWTLGEDVRTLRDLAVKRHRTDWVTVPMSRWNRNGGDGKTHDNGTIIGHAFHLMAEGCPRAGGQPAEYCKSVGYGMGAKKTLTLAYKLVTEMLTPTNDLDGLRAAAVAACRDKLRGMYRLQPRDCGVVINAFHAIGVGREDEDLDGIENGKDNCSNVYNPKQVPSKGDPGIGEACVSDDGSKVVSGDDGEFAVARIEVKTMRTAAMCNQAPDAQIEVKTSHVVRILHGEKRYLQVHLDKANKAKPSEKFQNDPSVTIKGLNCIWRRVVSSQGSYVSEGLSKEASIVVSERMQRKEKGKLVDGFYQQEDHDTVTTMTAAQIWGKEP